MGAAPVVRAAAAARLARVLVRPQRGPGEVVAAALSGGSPTTTHHHTFTLPQHPHKLVVCDINIINSGVAVVPRLVAPVGVGAGVLAGAVAVVEETLVHIEAGDGAAVAGGALRGWVGS